MADVTLDNEGPEKNNGSGYMHMCMQKKGKTKVSEAGESTTASGTCHHASHDDTLCQVSSAQVGFTIDSCQQATQESPSTGSILHETIACN